MQSSGAFPHSCDTSQWIFLQVNEKSSVIVMKVTQLHIYPPDILNHIQVLPRKERRGEVIHCDRNVLEKMANFKFLPKNY